MRRTLTISLPSELAKDIDKKARTLGISRSRVIQESLQKLKLEEAFRDAQDRATKKARSQGIFTDEDVFEALGLRRA